MSIVVSPVSDRHAERFSGREANLNDTTLAKSKMRITNQIYQWIKLMQQHMGAVIFIVYLLSLLC